MYLSGTMEAGEMQGGQHSGPGRGEKRIAGNQEPDATPPPLAQNRPYRWGHSVLCVNSGLFHGCGSEEFYKSILAVLEVQDENSRSDVKRVFEGRVKGRA